MHAPAATMENPLAESGQRLKEAATNVFQKLPKKLFEAGRELLEGVGNVMASIRDGFKAAFKGLGNILEKAASYFGLTDSEAGHIVAEAHKGVADTHKEEAGHGHDAAAGHGGAATEEHGHGAAKEHGHETPKAEHHAAAGHGADDHSAPKAAAAPEAHPANH